MPKIFKKFLLSFLSFLILFFSVAPNFMHAKAADAANWYDQGFFDWYAKVYDQKNPSEIFGERYTAAQVQWVVYGLLSLPLNIMSKTGKDVTTCFVGIVTLNSTDVVSCVTKAGTFVTDILNTLKISFALTETDNTKTNLAQSVFNPKGRPISGIRYVQDLTNRLSLVTKVHAQTGFGYTALDGIQKYWTGFRNMAYAIIVLITIIFAFLIMFRVKLNPQTVISVQSALPKIIIAVLLATFSYAIAGFLIDLMYVVAGLFASLLQMAGFAGSVTKAYESIIPTGTGAAGSFYIFFYMLGYTVLFAIAILWSFLTAIFGAFSIFGVIVSIVFIFVWVWLVVLMLWYTVKIPWVLIKNLVSIYISIVVAPLQIVIGSLVPSIGFGQWLKKMIAELLVFPVTGLFMYLAWLTLLNSYDVNALVFGENWRTLLGLASTPGKLWAPEIISSTGNISGLIWLAISFSLIAILPKVVDLMKSLIMGEKFSFGSAIGEAYGPIGGAVKGAGGMVSGAALGGGAVWVGGRLERSNVPLVQRFGRSMRGYGGKQLGQFSGPDQPMSPTGTSTIPPGKKSK